MSNRLAKETSPYLLQHADNPVDWYPWGNEAFELARETGKPVLLSVGYSACHWCHVMAHESFEDDSTAELMNRLFVNIKVDREERPDVDKIYQTAHQLLTQRGGGWPLTMFLSAEDQRPFFGGTYFPNSARHGLPGFAELLQKVASYYDERPGDVLEQGERLTDVLGRLDPAAASPDQAMSAAPIVKLREQLANSFDHDFGGWGDAPKFPHPTTIDRLLRTWRHSANDAEPDIEALFMATLTLTAAYSPKLPRLCYPESRGTAVRVPSLSWERVLPVSRQVTRWAYHSFTGLAGNVVTALTAYICSVQRSN